MCLEKVSVRLSGVGHREECEGGVVESFVHLDFIDSYMSPARDPCAVLLMGLKVDGL